MRLHQLSTHLVSTHLVCSKLTLSKLTQTISTHPLSISNISKLTTLGFITTGLGVLSMPTAMAALTIQEGNQTKHYSTSETTGNQSLVQYQNQAYTQYNQYQQPKTFNPSQHSSSFSSRYPSEQNHQNEQAHGVINVYGSSAANANSSSNSYNSRNSYSTYQPSSYDNSVNYFEDARQAARRQDDASLFQYEQMMQGGLFAMYPEYWRLDNNINNLPPSTVINFAQRYPNTVMAEKLIADYAENKAGTGDYASIQQVAPYVTNADRSEACAIAIGDVGKSSMIVAEQKSKVWLNTMKQPALCDQLAMELNTSAMVNNQDRQARLYRMLREGKSGEIMALSSRLGSAIDYSALQDIQWTPTNFFGRFGYQPYSQSNQYLYLYAIGKMANKSYREAAMQLEFDIRQDNQRRQHLLSEDTRKMAYRTLGVARMNMNTDDGFNPEAVDWFRKSVGLPFNYEEAEDYAMAGIRFNQWQDVITAITAMDGSHQQQPTWQYWLARAHEQIGNKRKARSIYKQLAKHNDYYGLLAKDKIGKRVSTASMGGNRLPTINDSKRRNALKDPHFARAFALYSINKNYAKREWNWGVNQALKNNDKELIIAAAQHAHDLGWHDRAIYALEKAKEKFGMLNSALSHPMPYQDSVVRYSQRAGIDPAWAYGIMRQESRFNIGAKSGVGAGGLMQIMPSTGKYIARQLGERYSSRRVNSGDTNIRYGTWYMGDILSKLGYQPVLATAGYNAGPNKAERWQPNFGNLAADQYVETIAYPETRDYVKHVMENATIYSNRLGRPQNISQRMGTIPPKY